MICDVEMFFSTSVVIDPHGWHCRTCDVEQDGFSTVEEARDGAENHRIEVATQQLIDEGELP